MSPDQLPALDLGVTGLMLIVVWRGLGIASDIFLSKKVPNTQPQYPMLACQNDPVHFQRIEEIHAMVKEHERQVGSGMFECAWKGRDEVRDSLELQRQLLGAVKDLTKEMRLTRNGSSK